MKIDWEYELNEIIENKRIRPVFQPIISLRDGNVLAYEALSRIVGPSLIVNIEELFSQAVRQGRIWELEQLCRVKAFRTLAEWGNFEHKLFLNVNPLVMHDEKFQAGFTKDYLNRYGISPEQVVMEITENSAVADNEAFRKTVCHYKNQNYEIALDDVGSCYSGLNLICDTKPNYMKMDRGLIQDIHLDGTKRALAESLVKLADNLGMLLIAEGIEKEEELDTLIQMGVHYGQGFLLGRPLELLKKAEKTVLACIRKSNDKRNRCMNQGVQKYYVDNISTGGRTVTLDVLVENVAVIFDRNPDLPGVTVLDNGKPAGIVTRDKLNQCLSGRYGFSLHQRKKISSVMQKNFLMVDYMTPISIVSTSAMERENNNLYDYVVVTSNEKYDGIVTVKELLQKTIEIAVAAAKLQNPLTELPGNLLIEEEIEKVLQHAEPYTVVYFDLDNFKAFNDVYGFEKGDMAIKELARVLRLNMSEGDFIGHIGGDDFVAVFRHYNCEYLCSRIVRDYEERVHRYYSPEDRSNGYIETLNRRGEKERFPLLSVTAAMADNRERKYTSVNEITELLAGRKKHKKNQKSKLAMAQ